MYEIIPNLYLGNHIDAWSFERLLHNHIHRVLQLTQENEQESTFDSPFIQREILPVQDTNFEVIRPFFPLACEIIDTSIIRGEPILVHCRAGISRAPTFVIAYLIWKMKIPYDIARDIVLQKCPFIDPNWGFIYQLQQWEQDCIYLPLPSIP